MFYATLILQGSCVYFGPSWRKAWFLIATLWTAPLRCSSLLHFGRRISWRVKLPCIACDGPHWKVRAKEARCVLQHDAFCSDISAAHSDCCMFLPPMKPKEFAGKRNLRTGVLPLTKPGLKACARPWSTTLKRRLQSSANRSARRQTPDASSCRGVPGYASCAGVPGCASCQF